MRHGFDCAFSAETTCALRPECGEGVDAVGIGGWFVAEDHDAAGAGIQEDIEPAVGGDHCTCQTQASEGGWVAAHGSHTSGRQGDRADDIDEGVDDHQIGDRLDAAGLLGGVVACADAVEKDDVDEGVDNHVAKFTEGC